MIIGIDASKAAVRDRTGVENFVYQLILNLAKIDHKNIYFLYTNSPLPKELKEQINFVEQLNQKKRFWNSWFLPIILRQYPCDVYLQATDKIPRTAPEKSVAVVHDFAWKYFPEAYSTFQNLRQRQTIENYASRAKKLICVSNSTRRDLVKYYPKLKTKTAVVPLGYDQNIFHPIDHPKDLLKIDAPYILYVGRIEERKNSVRLINAFVKLKKEKNIPHKLILLGSPGHNFESISHLIQNLVQYSKDVILPGFVNHAKLPEIIARSDVFAFPTLYEGFGLAVLEAMACGAAIVTSDTSSLPEVVGDGALLCDPTDENDIANKIYSLISDEKLRRKYSAAAISQAQKFSWEKTSKQTLDILEKL